MLARFQFLFGLADRSDFRTGVDDVWDHVVVHVPSLAGDDLGRCDTFFFRFVRKHRAGDGVADGVDARGVGAQMGIDDDAAAISLFYADGFEAKSFGEGHPADRHQHDVGLHRLGARRRLPARP